MWPEPGLTDAFAAALRDPAAPVPQGVARANGGDPLEAFNVYRNNVVASLAEALKAAFPVTSHLLGEGLQRALMADFARAHPPQSPVLSAYGDGFPAYLAAHPALASRLFVADVARLERAKLSSYHAADARALDAAVLAALDGERLMAIQLVAHPAARLVRSRFPILSISTIERRAMAGEPVEAARRDLKLDVEEAVLLTRPALDVELHPLTKGAAAFVCAAFDGEPFAHAAEAGFAADPSFDLQAALALLISAGAFTDLSLA